MKRTVTMMVLATGLLVGPAQAQPGRTDTKLVICGVLANGSMAAEKTPLARISIPWMPEGSQMPATHNIVASTYREYTIAKGNNAFYKIGCGSGETPAEAHQALDRFVLSYAKSGAAITELAFSSFWPPFMAYLSERRRDRRAEFVAEPAQ